jgi:hypothetical protein
MPGVVGGFVQNRGAREADHEDHEDTEQQRCHRADYLAPHTFLSGPNRSYVHCHFPDCYFPAA